MGIRHKRGGGEYDKMQTMRKEEVIVKVRESFIGHPVVFDSERNAQDMTMYKLRVGGQSFRMEDFRRMDAFFGDKASYMIMMDTLTVTIVYDNTED